MFFTIAIPSYNRAEILPLMLERIVEQVKNLSDYQIEILVLDDASTDNTIEILEAFKTGCGKFFRYIISEQNQGITKSRNILVKNALGNYIIFLDSDVLIAKDNIINHIEAHKNNKNIICQGSLKVVNSLENIETEKKQLLTDYSRSFFDTANLSIEKNKIIEAGFFDENFSGYGWEDLELGIRLKKLGLKVLRNKNILAYHYKPNDALVNLNELIEKEKQRAKGALYFLKKHNILEVKLMTQNTFFHSLLDKILTLILKMDNKDFIDNLKDIEKYNLQKFIILFKIYLNHVNIREMAYLLKNT